jgi:hypothetical protein
MRQRWIDWLTVSCQDVDTTPEDDIDSPEFAALCGRENLTRDGKLQAKDIFLFLTTQVKNPNCFFLEQLMQTKEYLSAVPKKGL